MAKILSLTKELKTLKQKVHDQDLEIRELRFAKCGIMMIADNAKARVKEQEQKIAALKGLTTFRGNQERSTSHWFFHWQEKGER